MVNYLVMRVTFVNGDENVFRIKAMPKIDGNLVLAQTTNDEKLIFNFQNIQYIKVN